MRTRRLLIVAATIAFVAATRPAEAQFFRRRVAPRYATRSFQFERSTTRTFAPVVATPFNAAAEARAVETEINAVRARYRLRPLAFDAELAAGSRDWSATQARFGDCFHGPGATAEICAAWQETPRFAVECWFDSGGHRAEMLNPRYSRVGAGVAVDRWGRRYWTARFR